MRSPLFARHGRALASATLLVLVLPASPRPARADGVITLDLPLSRNALAARTHASRAPATTPVLPRSRSRGSVPSRGGFAGRAVGRLGRIASATTIFRAPSHRAAHLTTAPAGTYLAIQGERSGWTGVLMADGSTGWAPRGSIEQLDYNVVTTSAAQVAAPPPDPVGSDPGDIYPRSTTPYFTGDSQRLIQDAERYLGVPYRWGGNTMAGIDCSGLVKDVFDAAGFPLPRLGSDQMAYGVPVPKDQLQPGDRLYFGRRTDRVGVTHTGLYIGNGYFIHASSSRHGVAVSALTEPMYVRMYVCARR